MPDATASSPEPTPPTPPEAEYANGHRIYRAGTLTYTRRGLVKLFSWLLWGDLAWSVRDRSLGEVINVFLKHFGATNTLAAFLRSTLPTVLNIVVSPLVSYKSDRHRGRFGRRRPFLFIGVPACAISMVGMAASPWLGKWIHPLAVRSWPGWQYTWSVLLVFGICYAIYDVASSVSNSVFAAFFNDVVPREVLGRFWGFARAVSIAVVIVFMGGLLGYAKNFYTSMFLAVGLIYGIGFMATAVMVKEGEYPPAADPSHVNANVFTKLFLGITAYMKECFSKPFYLWVFAAQLFTNNLAFASIYLWAQWFATSHKVGLDLGTYGKLTALYFILSLPLTPLLGWLADKIHPLRVVLVVLALHIPAALWGGLVIHDGKSFAIAYVITGLLQVLWGTATAALWPLLYPKDSYAQLASAAGAIGSIISLVFVLGLGMFLDYTKHVTHQGWFFDVVEARYRYTFTISAILDILGLIATIVVYRKFIALGGQKGYVAP
jgi:MFS family permease